MLWEDFLEKNKENDWFLILDKTHTAKFSYGSIDSFIDKGWPRITFNEGNEGVLTGLIVNHRLPNGNTCGGFVTFAKAKNPSEREAKVTEWKVQSLYPLTISPSILCHCDEHGFIKNGKWVSV